MKTHGTREIPLDQLVGNPANPNVCPPEIQAKLTENIRRSGYVPPLIVRRHPTLAERYEIIDGHHRMQALEALGWQTAPCEVIDATDAETGLLLATLNRLRGEDNPRKRAELLNSLTTCFEMPDLLKLIPESRSELTDLLALLNLEEAENAERIRQEIEKEEAALPVILSFMLSKADAELVEATLRAHQPTDAQDPARGLVGVCQLVKQSNK